MLAIALNILLTYQKFVVEDSSEHLSEGAVKLKGTSILEESIHSRTEEDQHPYDLAFPKLREQLLYESMLSLNSLLFLLEINGMSDKIVTFLVKKVIFEGNKPIMKIRASATDIKGKLEEMFKLFMNFSLKMDLPKSSLKDALEERNNYFERDVSQIAKSLYIEDLKALKGDLMRLTNDELRNLLDVSGIERKNDKYLRMVKALRKTIVETGNLSKSLQREKGEFTNEFLDKSLSSKKGNHKEITELKIAFNLGGSIFAPNVFLQMVTGILMADKNSFVENSVNKILKPIESLELYVRHKSNTEKKEEITKFLHACLEKKSSIVSELIDEAFKARSYVMEKFLRQEGENKVSEREGAIDRYQEKYIKEMIQKVGEVTDDSFEKFIVINGDIIQAFKDLLKLGSDKSKSRLIALFNK
jgi:hypothetical protein